MRPCTGSTCTRNRVGTWPVPGDLRVSQAFRRRYSRGVQRNEARAIELYTQSCNGNYMIGCVNLGGIYYDDPGPRKDEKRGVELFRRACNAGEKEYGCRNLCIAYRQQRGVNPNERAPRVCEAKSPPPRPREIGARRPPRRRRHRRSCQPHSRSLLPDLPSSASTLRLRRRRSNCSPRGVHRRHPGMTPQLSLAQETRSQPEARLDRARSLWSLPSWSTPLHLRQVPSASRRTGCRRGRTDTPLRRR